MLLYGLTINDLHNDKKLIMTTKLKYGIIGGIGLPMFMIILALGTTDMDLVLHSITDAWYLYALFICSGFFMGYFLTDVTKTKKETRIEKFRVCDQCYCVGIQDSNCRCAYGKYQTVELEFEVCGCCGDVLTDGQPADTEFNTKQLKNDTRK